MSMKMMNAAYLVDNVALLSLQEKQDGVEFHCFDMDSKVQIAEGHIGWDVLDCSVFLLRKFGKTGHSSVVRHKG